MPADIHEFPAPPQRQITRKRAEPCVVVILPVVRIERELTAAQRLGQFLNRVLDGDPTSRPTSADHTK